MLHDANSLEAMRREKRRLQEQLRRIKRKNKGAEKDKKKENPRKPKEVKFNPNIAVSNEPK